MPVSSLAPPSGIDELVQALDEHRAASDVAATRLRARRAGALREFALEHGEAGLRRLGGRAGAEALLDAQDAGLEVGALVDALERAAAGAL